MKKILPIRFTDTFTLILAAIFTGCAIEPVHFDGEFATYSHSTFYFEAVMLQADRLPCPILIQRFYSESSLKSLVF
jgi:hypothetical protein